MNRLPDPTTTKVSEARVLKGGAILAVGLFSAQILGFLRQVAIGYFLGTGREADAFTAAMAPIELWWSVLGAAVIYGFVPKFAQGVPGGDCAFRDIFVPVARFGAGVTLLMMLLADWIVPLFAPGFDEGTARLGANLLRVAGFAPLAVGASFVYTAFLFSRRRFGLAAFHQASVNGATVIGGIALHSQLGAYAFALGYAAGAWVQLAVVHVYARRELAKQTGQHRRVTMIELLTGPAPIVGQSLAVELSTAVTRAYASTFGPGMTAAFEYGYKLFRVPLALLVVPLSQSLLPEISSLRGTAIERAAGLRALIRGAWLVAGASLAATLAMALLRVPLVRILFERGEFGAESTAAVAVVLLSYLPVMAGRSLCDFFTRTLFGIGKYRVPVIATGGALLVNLAVCSLLPAADPLWIGAGAVAGYSIAALWVVWYVVGLRRGEGMA
jgi:putative peptidoglycan lipid II flippase